MLKNCLLMTACFWLAACVQTDITIAPKVTKPSTLPEPLSNQAVAYMNLDGQHRFFVFNGLRAGKTFRDITNQAHVWMQGQWHQLPVPATQQPVLASVAVVVKNHVYLMGGYTVAADHSEQSIPHVWKIDGRTLQWQAMPAMPTPVDDTVALVYQDRYIYLISGWHDVDNVDLVQVFDTETLNWHQATPIDFPAVFGHAGAISGNQMLICDGVKVKYTDAGIKQFLPSPVCALGTIDPNDVKQIDWQAAPHHSGTAYYRMAANQNDKGQMIFVGGGDNPYNYDGIGYNKTPANASDRVRWFSLAENKWRTERPGIPANMDHRGLLKTPEHWVILGGMRNPQQVTKEIIYLRRGID